MPSFDLPVIKPRPGVTYEEPGQDLPTATAKHVGLEPAVDPPEQERPPSDT